MLDSKTNYDRVRGEFRPTAAPNPRITLADRHASNRRSQSIARFILAFTFVLFAIALEFQAKSIAAEPNLVRFEESRPRMGCPFRIVVYAANEPAAKSAIDAAFDRVSKLNQAFSDYDPESELMRLCARAGGPAIAVSDDLFKILDLSIETSRISDGAFDVTCGPVVRLWRRARRDRKLPDPELLKNALAKVDWKAIELDRSGRTVRLLKPGMKLDLGGIAKGYAAQAALVELRNRGIDRALVAAAGDIAVADPPPGTEGWSIAIASLNPTRSAPPAKILLLKNACVSTAGDAEQYVEINGKRYSHIVDPRTGLGVVRRASVTVIAADGATADRLDTAAYVLGEAAGTRLIDDHPGASALFLTEENGAVSIKTTRRFAAIKTLDPNESSIDHAADSSTFQPPAIKNREPNEILTNRESLTKMHFDILTQGSPYDFAPAR